MPRPLRVREDGRVFAGSISTPIAEDSKWAWHPIRIPTQANDTYLPDGSEYGIKLWYSLDSGGVTHTGHLRHKSDLIAGVGDIPYTI